MRKKRKRCISQIAALCLGLIAAASIVGCVPNHVSDDVEKKIIAEGEPVLKAYLDTLPEKYEIDSFYMENGAAKGQGVYTGYYPSHVVGCRFKIKDYYCNAIVNTENGEIWTDYNSFDLNEQLARQLKPYFEKYGYTGEYAVTDAYTEYYAVSHDIPDKKGKETLETEVRVNNLIPADLDGDTEEARADAFLKNAPISEFKILYAKEGDSYLTPKVLSDYLKESGNYAADGDEQRVYAYEMNSLSAEGMDSFRETASIPVREGLEENWEMTLYFTDSPDDMEYELSRRKTKEEDGFTLVYPQLFQSGSLQSLEKDEAEHYDCFVERKDNALYYDAGQVGVHPHLYFKEKPEFTEISRTCIIDGKEEKPEKLDVIDLGEGLYSLTDGKTMRLDPYYFADTQTITFTK